MKINLVNTSSGFKCASDEDYENKRKLKIGEVYSVDIKLKRNYQFHKMYFALINCAWEHQNEKRQNHFKNSIDKFRKSVELAAGHSETFWDIKNKREIEQVKSISFEKMDNSEFSELYDNVKNVLFEVFLNHISEQEFERELINF